jgi:hypothetical protein
MNTYIGEVLQQLHDTSDAEAIHMMHAVKTIRNETLTSKFEFDGQLSLAKCEAPPMFHALTGCDTVFLTWLGNSYSPKNRKCWKCCPLHPVHLSSMLNERYIKQFTVGHSVWYGKLFSMIPACVVGVEMIVNGYPNG